MNRTHWLWTNWTLTDLAIWLFIYHFGSIYFFLHFNIIILYSGFVFMVIYNWSCGVDGEFWVITDFFFQIPRSTYSVIADLFHLLKLKSGFPANKYIVITLFSKSLSHMYSLSETTSSDLSQITASDIYMCTWELGNVMQNVLHNFCMFCVCWTTVSDDRTDWCLHAFLSLIDR